jgi:hypothetical protein
MGDGQWAMGDGRWAWAWAITLSPAPGAQHLIYQNHLFFLKTASIPSASAIITPQMTG